MNEKIKQLAEQATECYSNGQERSFDKEKFAELIVKECIGIANNIHMCRDGKVIAEDIKQHFGVEE